MRRGAGTGRSEVLVVCNLQGVSTTYVQQYVGPPNAINVDTRIFLVYIYIYTPELRSISNKNNVKSRQVTSPRNYETTAVLILQYTHFVQCRAFWCLSSPNRLYTLHPQTATDEPKTGTKAHPPQISLILKSGGGRSSAGHYCHCCCLFVLVFRMTLT